MNYEYKLNCGQYVLHCDGRPIGPPLEEVAIALDKTSGTLHKHGAPELVSNWLANAKTKFRNGGYPDMADELVMISGRFVLEDLNRCLTTSGFAGVLYERLMEQSLMVQEALVRR